MLLGIKNSRVNSTVVSVVTYILVEFVLDAKAREMESMVAEKLR